MNKILLAIWFLFIFILIAFGVAYCEMKMNVSTWITRPVGFVIGFYMLIGFPMKLLKLQFKKELQELSDDDLKREVSRYHKEYFQEIGEKEPEVILFHELLQKQDFKRILKEWNSLSKRFAELERKNGHTGRPLIMDYYNWYELCLKELIGRT